MRELIVEILLRFSRVLAASALGAILYLDLTGPLAVVGSPEIALLTWLCGAAVVLLFETSPI